VGEPPEWAEVYRFLPIVRPVKRGDWRREAAARGFKWNAENADAGRNPDAGSEKREHAAKPSPGTEGRPLLRPEKKNPA
jgi:hypothetical protein